MPPTQKEKKTVRGVAHFSCIHRYYLRELTRYLQRKRKSQDEKAVEIQARAQHQLHVEFEGLLKTIVTRVSLWADDSLRYLRNFCNTIASNRDKFPSLMGDEEMPVRAGDDEDEGDTVALTEGYIAALAAGKDTSEEMPSPILAVLSRQTGFHDVLRQENESSKTHQKVKLTHLTLVDGDNNTIHARMATHIADAGRALGEGDVIRLDLFTTLTYHVNDESPVMPAIFIIKFSHLRHIPLPLQKDIKDMLPYAPSLPKQQKKTSAYPIIDPLTQEPPQCTYENRLCRKYGVNFIGRCICDEIPVKERNLDTIAEDCHLIDKPASEIKDMKPRRLMLYWWYATNIYSLTGQGNRGKLPDCLEYAIKAAYPEKRSEDWTGFIPAAKGAKRQKTSDEVH